MTWVGSVSPGVLNQSSETDKFLNYSRSVSLLIDSCSGQNIIIDIETVAEVITDVQEESVVAFSTRLGLSLEFSIVARNPI